MDSKETATVKELPKLLAVQREAVCGQWGYTGRSAYGHTQRLTAECPTGPTFCTPGHLWDN